ncbi:diphthamide biosynthesis enzyme Dph2 [Candidatus Bathyarchaeota archaeon]|nr:diphthamide biosynthesis enzyme Dph2 [Candidatus Bathyarchaeota archaeon]NIU81798.1 diphthamide biosynthesis enzyme Dph2 [Candidatus Bathyarchaeota archaeon]NIV68440.1 diphthamide biosynthesis enzyme Dph2 [Candidatus Bathyarchaeota archaeon]NIW16381.1 diphthamide biosynthesis enzyme Dph2 [Candidatus Bathyarchaeota archaeon]NIW34936.1 diphthamide biosynthesis enzyme Dph2 [Candidatus Bathyarchaeota archaeon]
MVSHDLEEERLRKEIEEHQADRVLLQLPEGLKSEAPYLASITEEAGATALVSADPCYGACDLALPEAESLGVDLIIHYGHTQILKQHRIPTVYMEARAKVDVEDAVMKAIPLLKNWELIGLVTTVQHIHRLEATKDTLSRAGKRVIVGDTGRPKYAGQVLGCDFSNAKSVSQDVEAFLFLGGGRFHATGVTLATGKPTVIADPYQKTAFTTYSEAKNILKRRWAAISEARKAGRFGVLIGLKSGQKKVTEAVELKEKLEKVGKRATLLAIREIAPEALMQFPLIEAFVNTACPRVSLNDAKNFLKPVITSREALLVLQEMTWEELCREGWFES